MIDVRTSEREQLLDVTARVAETVAGSSVEDGMALVYCPHTTAAVCVNENADPDVVTDVVDALRGLCPANAGWLHREGNADAHAKAVLVGESATIPVVGGSLLLGPWQGIFFCEFDGPRSRELHVSVSGA
jgi:secondary thiamine-phosphate synthase enzyme